MMDLNGQPAVDSSARLQANSDLSLGIRVRTKYSMQCFRRGELLWEEEFYNAVTTQGLNHIITRVIKGQTRQAAGTAGYCDGRMVPKIRANSTAYVVGEVIQPPAGNAGEGSIQICITAGTSAGAAPAYSATPDTTTVDGGATFVCATQLYIGLVDNAGFSSYAAGDTLASHAGWSEFTAYSEARRQLYVPGSVSGGSCDNSASVATFTLSSNGAVNGAFMTDDRTKGGTGATTLLYGTGTFTGGARTGLQTNDQLKVTVTTSVS